MAMHTLQSVKWKARRIVEDVLGIEVHRSAQHGCQDWRDIRKSGCRIGMVFDVGANTGQSAVKFVRAFPNASIHCFEPVGRTFEQLEANLSRYTNVECHSLALGSSRGSATIHLTADSRTSSLVRPADATSSETVTVETVDDFAFGNGIERIDLLKVDAEGFDLEVLKGAARMLSAGKIAFVLVEVGFHSRADKHVLFDDVRAYLMEKGFSVFGIYDQQLEWSGENRLRYANVCFCNEKAFTGS